MTIPITTNMKNINNLTALCPTANKKGKTTVHKHQLIGAIGVKKHKNLQHVKERLSV
ncbi:MAG: hypothetical protein GXY94_13115 [Bacteroidales bacterium]|jgi:hypothetical protein|nr:hypothetical protein [Bacteroidales bacterium]